VDLQKHNTLGLAARSAQAISVHHAHELPGISERLGQAPRCILGSGSNVVLHAPLSATVLLSELKGKSIDATGVLTAASGENWHELVMWSLGQGFAGLENLALIPGTAGAAPVQNIGAYGVELKDSLMSLTAWDFSEKTFRRFKNIECRFGYRDSLFKRPDVQGAWNNPRFFITEIELQLVPFGRATVETSYGEIANELAANAISCPGPQEIADAVISIRKRKLPDPNQLGNVGSFFKNPIVSAVQAKTLKLLHPDLPQYDMPIDHGDSKKLSAAWLIERCGFKGVRRGDVGVHANHALVLVNYGGGTGREILSLAQEIQQAVVGRFGVFLEPEPVFMPAL
jgi:UDP-N-acetylmuramate dehydrogenase